MKLSKLQFKKLFYPNKESYAILFQAIITFILIGAILLTKSFITNFSNQKYSYLSDTSFMEEGEEQYTLNDLPDILKTQEEKLKKYQSILKDKEMRSDINYWTSFYMKPNSVQAIGTYSFLISNHIKEAFHYTSNEEFIVDSLKEKKGLYISRYLSEKEQIQIGDFVTIYKDNYFNESFKCQIVGIYEAKNEEIRQRIYCDEDLFAREEIDKENLSFSVEYLFIGSKPLNTKQLQSIALNSSHTFYSKGIFLSEEKLVFDNFFKVADVYLYLSTGIMGISLFLLAMIKGIKSQEVYYIENIYYKKNEKILLNIILKNLLLIWIGFIISTFVLLLISLILFAIFKFYFFVTIEY
ncbi:MAG: hypothetical protein K2I42_07390, partial [Anaeroplasmataceae bacterium]|nr:hypothetical protein [Anaeroplasmataceae bacterium]